MEVIYTGYRNLFDNEFCIGRIPLIDLLPTLVKGRTTKKIISKIRNIVYHVDDNNLWSMYIKSGEILDRLLEEEIIISQLDDLLEAYPMSNGFVFGDNSNAYFRKGRNFRKNRIYAIACNINTSIDPYKQLFDRFFQHPSIDPILLSICLGNMKLLYNCEDDIKSDKSLIYDAPADHYKIIYLPILSRILLRLFLLKEVFVLQDIYQHIFFSKIF